MHERQGSAGTAVPAFFPAFLLVFLLAVLLSGCGTDALGRLASDKQAFVSASEALKAGDYRSAEKQFEKLVEEEQYPAESYRGLGIARLYQGNYMEAAIAFSYAKLHTEGQEDSFVRDVDSYLAYCRYKQGETAEALAMYDALLEQEDSADFRYLRGRILMADGRTDEAVRDFRRAAELSTDYNLFISIYEQYIDHKMNADGAEFLRDALASAQAAEEEHYGLGVIYYYLEDYERAKEELILDLRSDHDDERAVLLLGKTYLAMNDAANARAMYREYAENPNCAAAAYNGLALCDIKEGRYDSALRNISEGLALKDDTVNESLLYNEIILYELKENWETAKEKAAAFAAMYPANEAGQRENEFLSSR